MELMGINRNLANGLSRMVTCTRIGKQFWGLVTKVASQYEGGQTFHAPFHVLIQMKENRRSGIYSDC